MQGLTLYAAAGTIDDHIVRHAQAPSRMTAPPMISSLLLGLAMAAGQALQAQSPPLSCNATSAARQALPAGASVAMIDSAALAPFFNRTLSEALAARMPGVSVMRSNGVAGGGSRIRLRGVSGIVAPQQPLLYIDGIRVDGELQSIGLEVGDYAPSRVDDVPVDDVDCIYVFRGPATSARYGTDAAYGVIHVITRRARSSDPRVHVALEGGTTADQTTYPANYGDTNNCSRARAAQGQCVPGTVRRWSPLDADIPFRTAPLFHASARARIVDGPRTSVAVSAGGTARDGAMRINEHRDYSTMANASLRPTSAIDVSGSLWVLGAASRLPLVGNPSLGILNSALQGSSVDDPVRRGYRRAPLSVLEQLDTDQDVRRIGGAAYMRWSPTSRFSIHATAGREDSRVEDQQFWPSIIMSQLPNVGPPRIRSTAEQRAQQSSAELFATLSYGHNSLRFTTEVGGDYRDQSFRKVVQSVDIVDPNGFSNYESVRTNPSATGLLVRQAVAIGDRLQMDGGVRHDVLSLDFLTVEHPTYPFASAAFVPVSDPASTWSLLRFRAAFGESGESRSLLPFALGGITVPVGTPENVQSFSVERTREIEGGLDVGLIGDRVSLSATYFLKRTTDGLVHVGIPPGGGAPLRPLASWENRGAEVELRA